jgi:hypothetical protein
MNQPADGDTSQPETLCLIGGVLPTTRRAQAATIAAILRRYIIRM